MFNLSLPPNHCIVTRLGGFKTNCIMFLETTLVDSYQSYEFEYESDLIEYFKKPSPYNPTRQYVIFYDSEDGWEVHVVL